MMTVVPLLSLLGAALFLSRVLPLRIELVPVQVLSGAVVVLYAAMLAGLLPPTVYGLVLAGLIALAYEVFRARDAWRRLLTPGIVLFVVFYCVLAVLMRGLDTVYWDEFGTWALLPKLLLALGTYPTQEGLVLARDYVPGPALAQYLFAKVIGGSEGDVIFGHGVFMLTALLTLFAPLRWSRPAPIAATLVIGLLLPYYFGDGGTGVWSSLLVDHLFPLLFAAVLAIYWFGGADTKAILAALPVLAALRLIKDAGIAFVGIALAIIIVDQCLRAIFDARAWREAVGPGRIGVWWLGAAIIGAAVAPLLVAKSWGLYLSAHAIPPLWNFTWAAVLSHLRQPEFGPFAAELLTKFGGALAGTADIGSGPQVMPIGVSLTFTLPYWLLALGILVAFCLVVYRSALDRARVLVANTVLAAGFAGYTLLLLVHYLLAWSPLADALKLPSFGRYLGAFIFAWVLANLVLLLAASGTARRAWLAAVLLVGIAYASYHYAPPKAFASLREGPRGETEQGYLRERRAVQALLAGVKEAIPESKRVYIVWNNTTGFPFYIARYELTPRVSNGSCFGFGPARYQGDLWSCDLPSQAVAGMFKQYDFVFLGHADQPFWERYASLFEPGAESSGHRLFRVEPQGPGPLLRAVDIAQTAAANPAAP